MIYRVNLGIGLAAFIEPPVFRHIDGPPWRQPRFSVAAMQEHRQAEPMIEW